MDVRLLVGLVLVGSVGMAALSQFKALIGLNWSIWFVVGMLALIPFQIYLPVTSQVTGATLCALALFAAGVMRWLFSGYLFEDSTTGLMAVLICTLAANALTASAWRPGLDALTGQLWMLMCYFGLAQNLQTKKQQRLAVLALLGGGVAVALFGLGIMLTAGQLLKWVGQLGLTFALYNAPEPPVIGSSQLYSYNILYDPTEVNFATFVNVDYFGSFLIAPIMVSLALLVTHRRSKWRWAYALSLAVTVVALFTTQGRGALLAAIAGAGVMAICLIWVKGARSSFWAALIAFAFAVLIVAGWMLSSSSFVASLDRMVELPEKFTVQHIERSMELRSALWSEALGVAMERPWLGWGGASTSLQSRLTYNQAHSWYIETLIESGIVGLAVRLALVLVTIKKCFAAFLGEVRAGRSGFAKALALGLGCFWVAFLIDGIANDPTRAQQNTMLFWSLIGLVAAASARQRPQREAISAGDVNSKVLTISILTLLGLALSLSIVFLQQYLYILSVVLGLVMLGLGLTSTASWIKGRSRAGVPPPDVDASASARKPVKAAHIR